MHWKAIHSRLAQRRIYLIGLCFVLVAALLTSLTVAMVWKEAAAQAERQAQSELFHIAAGLRERLDRRMADFCRVAKINAELESAENPSGTPGLRRRTLDHMSKQWPEFTWIAFASLDGRVLQATGNLLEGQDISLRPWFQRAMSGKHVTDVHQALLLQDLLGSNEPLRFVDITYPVRDQQGNPKSILAVHASWEFANVIAKASREAAETEAGLELLIHDSQGNVLLGPNGEPRLEEEVLRNLQAASRLLKVESRSDQTSQFVVHVASLGMNDFPGLGWIITARQDTQEAMKPLREFETRLWFWSGMGLLTFIAFAAALAYGMSRPLPLEEEAPAPGPEESGRPSDE
ncbi:MAG: cache domain-containing protein [Burkholderiales bacterium]|nr:cache domain-containing protein [Burkholderiales bacterium]